MVLLYLLELRWHNGTRLLYTSDVSILLYMHIYRSWWCELWQGARNPLRAGHSRVLHHIAHTRKKFRIQCFTQSIFYFIRHLISTFDGAKLQAKNDICSAIAVQKLKRPCLFINIVQTNIAERILNILTHTNRSVARTFTNEVTRS